jgi:hypothetical protein
VLSMTKGRTKHGYICMWCIDQQLSDIEAISQIVQMLSIVLWLPKVSISWINFFWKSRQKDFEKFQNRSRKTLKISPKNRNLNLLFNIEPISQNVPNFVNRAMVTQSIHFLKKNFLKIAAERLWKFSETQQKNFENFPKK